MAGNPYIVTITGPSSTGGFGLWMPDTMAGRGSFNVSVGCITTSSSLNGYTVQHTWDYPGQNSSAFTTAAGWISSNANWFSSSGIVAVSSNAMTSYNYPVSAIRLNSTTGSSLGSVTMTIIQSG